MKRSAVTQSRGRRRGFTLVEVLISVAVLLTVLALVFQQISAMQKMSQPGCPRSSHERLSRSVNVCEPAGPW
jgi:prepilin-type N-terminal cleavage/methylation domain-containing protein